MCVLVSYVALSETSIILKKILRNVIGSVHRSSCKVPIILVRF